MTNTVAHTPLKRGTSARLGLRLPKPRVRVDRLILAPADVWIAERRAGVQTTVEYFDTAVPWRTVPIPVVNVTASRRGEPVHVSEVIRELIPKLRPLSRVGMPFEHTAECCGTTHTFDAGVSSWLPGCTHLGSV